MPLFFQQDINAHTKLAVWKIEEDEDFFLQSVPVPLPVRHPQKRLQHLAGRYLLQHLFPSFPFPLIQIADTRKPFLPNEEYHFSISHCRDFAAAIVSTQERVGVDVELVTQKVQVIRHKFLNPVEMRFVNSQPVHIQTRLLTVLWSAKEAMFKWYGKGEVDFKEMMQTFPFMINDNGGINAAFINESLQKSLALKYCLFNDLCLVWLNTDANQT